MEIQDYMRIKPEQILVFDTETTGIPSRSGRVDLPEHEMLQLCMMDGAGKVLFNELFRPVQWMIWPSAQQVNGISPEMVRDRKSASEWRDEIQAHIDNAALLVAYNFDFDYHFLRRIDVRFGKKQYCDVMKLHTWIQRQRGFRVRHTSLVKCAASYGLTSFAAHDALGDVQATLHCYHSMIEELKSLGTIHGDGREAEDGPKMS